MSHYEDWNNHPCPKCGGRMRARVRVSGYLDRPHCSAGCDLSDCSAIAEGFGDYCVELRLRMGVDALWAKIGGGRPLDQATPEEALKLCARLRMEGWNPGDVAVQPVSCLLAAKGWEVPIWPTPTTRGRR